MSFLTTDYSENTSNNFAPVPEGTYECIIYKVQEQATKNGAESLQIDLLVRNDLDKVPALSETNAKFHNRHIFMDNWKRRATNQYDLKGFQYILEASGVPEGTQINDVDDFVKAILGTPVEVYIKQETEEYQGKTHERNQIAPWSFKKSQYPEVQHRFKDGKAPMTDPFGGNDDTIEVNDDDVPF